MAAVSLAGACFPLGVAQTALIRSDRLVSGALYPKDDVLGIAVNPLPKI